MGSTNFIDSFTEDALRLVCVRLLEEGSEKIPPKKGEKILEDKTLEELEKIFQENKNNVSEEILFFFGGVAYGYLMGELASSDYGCDEYNCGCVGLNRFVLDYFPSIKKLDENKDYVR